MTAARRRRLGQNFLADRGVAQRIAGLLREAPARVLEIGPGRGALTGPLLERFGRVLALELDAQLLPGLRQRFAGTGLELREADAVREPLDELLAAEAPWQVAANLPYSVGTAIVRRLLPRHDLVTGMVLMLQREVAERFVAGPAGRGHGILALERAAWAEARIAFDVPPRAFRPVPKVTSSVLVLELRPAAYDAQVLTRALALAGHALLHPRKTLANALRPLGDAAVIEEAGVDPQARPGTLSLEAWVGLAEVLPSQT